MCRAAVRAAVFDAERAARRKQHARRRQRRCGGWQAVGRRGRHASVRSARVPQRRALRADRGPVRRDRRRLRVQMSAGLRRQEVRAPRHRFLPPVRHISGPLIVHNITGSL